MVLHERKAGLFDLPQSNKKFKKNCEQLDYYTNAVKLNIPSFGKRRKSNHYLRLSIPTITHKIS